MNSEYERKFLLKSYPFIFTDFSLEHIKQWYISRPEDNISVRIRLYDDGRCYIDFKRGLGVERYEYGFKCPYDDIKGLIYDVPFVEKDRFKLHVDNYLLIIDEFTNGLKLVEIESDDLNFIKNFEPFDWMGEEVTDDIEYTNNWIAYDNRG
jgi:CYTH domain-containing protein